MTCLIEQLHLCNIHLINMFCESLALFGSLFLGFFGYLVQNDMPYLKFKMVNKENTQNALYTSSLVIIIINSRSI